MSKRLEAPVACRHACGYQTTWKAALSRHEHGCTSRRSARRDERDLEDEVLRTLYPEVVGPAGGSGGVAAGDEDEDPEVKASVPRVVKVGLLAVKESRGGTMAVHAREAVGRWLARLDALQGQGLSAREAVASIHRESLGRLRRRAGLPEDDEAAHSVWLLVRLLVAMLVSAVLVGLLLARGASA